jgi:hypothetical protein
VDNHDVERIFTKLENKQHMIPVHALLFTLPGIPSIYYGSEFGIEGAKMRGGSDDAIRPALNLDDYKDAVKTNPYTAVIAALGRMHAREAAVLAYGNYKEELLTTTHYAFSRSLQGRTVYTTVNNADDEAWFDLPAGGADSYTGAIFGETVKADNGQIHVKIGPNSAEVWEMADGGASVDTEEVNRLMKELEEKQKQEAEKKAAAEAKEAALEAKLEGTVAVPNKPYEEMSVEELQAAIILKMKKNGPVTDQMRKTVFDNVYHDSLVNWVKSFR